MKHKKTFIALIILIIIVPVVGFIYFFYHTPSSMDYNSYDEYCEKSEVCDTRFCEFGCVGGGADLGCAGGCYAKPCYKYNFITCPIDQGCEVGTACSGEKICESKPLDEEPQTFFEKLRGKNDECSAGHTRKCGEVNGDGECDYKSNSVPYCMPCGNGICQPNLENKCNCPEDCK